MISEGQGTTPGFRDDGAFQIFEERLRIRVGDGHHRDLHKRGGFRDGEALRTCFGGPTRGERIAGVENHVHHAAALDAIWRTICTFGEDIALKIAVVTGIGIDEAADGTVFGSDLGFDAAPTAAVAGDDDFAFHVDTFGGEGFVVSRDTIVDVNEGSADVAVAGIGVEAGDHAGVGGVLVSCNSRFGEFGGKTFGDAAVGRDGHFQQP